MIIYRFRFVILVIFISGFGLQGFSGPGGSHSHGHGHSHTHKKKKKLKITNTKAKSRGLLQIHRLIKKNKINDSWKKAKFHAAEKKKFGKRTEWVVTYDNPKGVKGQRLYIFLNLLYIQLQLLSCH